MATTKPRITVTLPPRHHEVLSRLSAASGDSMSEIVAGFVELAVPSLERLVVVLERAKAAPQEMRAGLAAAVDRADRDLMPLLQRAATQNDLFLADLDAAARPPPPAAAAPAPGARRKGSTPVAVTRGSGRSKGGRRGPV